MNGLLESSFFYYRKFGGNNMSEKCKECGSIMRGNKCRYCCDKYENSFAYHIQIELNEPLEKYWDFEKNTLNPYLLSKKSHKKVWIKCIEKDYHGAYEVSCANFSKGKRCSYCANHKIHPKDSFAQYHIDNTSENFLEKYWSDKNTLNPWELTPNTHKKVWIRWLRRKVSSTSSFEETRSYPS